LNISNPLVILIPVVGLIGLLDKMPSLQERLSEAKLLLEGSRSEENLSKLAQLQRLMGNTTDALTLLTEILQLRKEKNCNNIDDALIDLGSLQRNVGDLEGAKSSLEEALAIQEQGSSKTADILLLLSTVNNNSSKELRMKGLSIVCSKLQEESKNTTSTSTSKTTNNNTRASETRSSETRSSELMLESARSSITSVATSNARDSSTMISGSTSNSSTLNNSRNSSPVDIPAPMTPPQRRSSFIDLDDEAIDEEVSGLAEADDISLPKMLLKLQSLYDNRKNKSIKEDIKSFKEIYLKMEGDNSNIINYNTTTSSSSVDHIKQRRDVSETLNSDESLRLLVLGCKLLEELIDNINDNSTDNSNGSSNDIDSINIDEETIVNKHTLLLRESKLATPTSSNLLLKSNSIVGGVGSSSSSKKKDHYQRAASTNDTLQPLVKGYLSKMSSSSFRGWQRRWFVLRKFLSSDNTSWNYEVRYWRSEKDEKKEKQMRGRFPVNQIIKIDSNSKGGGKKTTTSFSILVSTAGSASKGKKIERRHKRTYYLDASKEDDKKEWMNCLTAALEEERDSDESDDDEEDD
jgi:tetratricopeptide (TPR) repeat protein